MKILVVGSGGREHVLVWKLSQSPLVAKIYCAPGNAGTAQDAENLNIPADDVMRLAKFAKENGIDLTVVGPEAPLVAGIVDEFRRQKLNVFGPTASAARLEGSKVFTKKLLRRANIPTANFAVFSRMPEAMQYLEDSEEQPLVVKADGLAAGKGVFVCANRAEARAAVKSVLQDRTFGEAGSQVVIEECLVGHEASILALVDGDTIVPLDVAQDHKRAYDHDLGPNTGGMGAYCPAPLVTPTIMDDIIRRILIPTIHTMKVEGCPFSGVLYAGIMLTANGPKVLEYNVRFGDPEAQPVLMRLRSDLAHVLLLAATGRLTELESLDWDPRPAVCVVMASEGYPGEYAKGRAITGIQDADALPDTKVFHAGTAIKHEQVVNTGGRVLGITALGDTIAEAKQNAYAAVNKIQWQGGWCRSDISDKA
ncbi:MAG: phosphoribosylamine--glycine ligase [Planctomycetota bacterium]|jgi:phosphoribosylamine--glycine ligase|nr:phosphoribosylamine--glycine ligase [Planctomycetales bacterium]RLT09751.1 MAG: phosphoribosylamine--glycine ligase [Planctomycetota bacterium]